MRRFGKVIQRLRPDKHESCLVIGPSDHGKRKRGKIISDKATKRLIAWQREVALSSDCAFLDARAIMGGEGSMGRWVKRGLGWHDMAHFTPKGMRTMGTAIYAAYLQGLRGYLVRSARPPP
jgi:predicted acyl esterase